MWAPLWIAGVSVAVVVAAYFYQRRQRQRLAPESRFEVSFDAAGILVTDPSGDSRRAPWNQLTKVVMRTTDEGPFLPDVFWAIHTGDDGPAVVFPGGATGEGELLRELQRRLAGFENERLIEAMSSTSNASFVLWDGQRLV